MKKKRWTSEEKEFVISGYSTMSVSEISEHLKRSEDSIRQFATLNKLSAKNNSPDWTREELLFIKANYKKLKAEDIAKKLGRSRQAVTHKVSILGLNKNVALPNDLSLIQKNVPIPLVGKKGQYFGLLTAMDVDDSFEYPDSERQTVTDAAASVQNKLFKSFKIDEFTRRIWRIL